MSLSEALSGNVAAQAALADECLARADPGAPDAVENLAQAQYWTCLALTRGEPEDNLRAATLMISKAGYEARFGWSDTAIARIREAIMILDQLAGEGLDEAGVRLNQLVSELPAHIVRIIDAMRVGGIRITPIS